MAAVHQMIVQGHVHHRCVRHDSAHPRRIHGVVPAAAPVRVRKSGAVVRGPTRSVDTLSCLRRAPAGSPKHIEQLQHQRKRRVLSPSHQTLSRRVRTHARTTDAGHADAPCTRLWSTPVLAPAALQPLPDPPSHGLLCTLCDVVDVAGRQGVCDENGRVRAADGAKRRRASSSTYAHL
jgi:hypothetical protein